MKIKVIGTGSYLPETIVSNEDFTKLVDTSDEWIQTRTGIKERHISSGEDTWEAAVKAANNAIDNAGISAETIDFIIACTITPDYYLPSLACIVQWKTGAKNAFAFDLNAACSGFIYAFDIASSLIETGKGKRAMIVCSEFLSKITDYTDRSTCVLFGDGAGAVILEKSDKDGILASFLKSEGEGAKFIAARALKTVSPFAKENPELIEGLNKHYVYMDGKEVYKFAIRAMPASIEEVLRLSGVNPSDITYFLPHQANKRIIDAVAAKYGLDLTKTIINIDRYGNTSSACIPIMLDEMNREGKLKDGNLLIMTGFGAGLTYGAILFKWN